MLAACFAPQPQPGAPCADGQCPSGLVCVAATETCERSAVDAPPVTTDASRSPVDASDPPDPPDAPPGLACFGAGLVSICPSSPANTPVVLGTMQIDTDTSPLCVSYSGTSPGAFCVIAGSSVSVPEAITAVGSRPLVLLATGSMTIDGTIDAASHRGQPAGAGGNAMTCVAEAAATGLQGGPGGSSGTRGGTGGRSTGGGPGPAASAANTVTTLQGGCAGGDGAGTQPGIRGSGGGAVYLIAGTAITINGTINASGAGGGPATEIAGGGGGGAGGLIGLDAPSVVVGAAAQLFANGGGGGEGGTQNKDGNAGEDPPTPTAVANGGANASPKGGDGGDGAAGMLDARSGQSGGACDKGPVGGGGGGGGAGVILVFPAQALGGSVSPPPT